MDPPWQSPCYHLPWERAVASFLPQPQYQSDTGTALPFCIVNSQVWGNKPYLRDIERTRKSGIHRHHPKKGIWSIF